MTEMFVYIGIAVVVCAVVGGYMMEHGNLAILVQPVELIIIFGAALGALLIASPAKVVKLVFKDVVKIFKDESIHAPAYLELLMLLNVLFRKMKKEGVIAIEGDIETPHKSPIFNKFKSVVSNHQFCTFLCDNLRVIVSGGMPPHELESLIDLDIEVREHEELIPSVSIAKIADSLPGLGIVAAVLGVVLTMEKINEPPAVLGHCISVALVGTFLGVLACYGFIAPMATNLEHQAKDKVVYFNVIKTALVSFAGGSGPQIAIESARRAIPEGDRPSFADVEKEMKKWKAT